MTPPPTVFIDSSVFFAAAYSVTGSAHDLLLASYTDRVVLIVSDYVLTETERNLRTSAPGALPAFERLRTTLPFRIVTPTTEDVMHAARIIAAKDAPIVAGAWTAGARFLASYDRKDLLSKRSEIGQAFGILVVTPDEIVRAHLP